MNFTPNIIKTNKIIDNVNFNKLYCKNFIFTILILELFNSTNKNKTKVYNLKIFFLKKKKTLGSILRAPYKNKTAQFNICLNRYYLILSFIILLNINLKINNYSDFLKINNNLINSYKYFESTLITQISRKIYIPISIKLI